MFSKVDYAMITVSDMSRSVEFYRDRLGLKLKFESPGWSEFDTGETTLALHGGGAPQNRPAVTDDQRPQAGTCAIGFTVNDADKAYEDLKSRGVRFVMPPTTREQEGIRLAICSDPDGLPVSIAATLSRGATVE